MANEKNKPQTTPAAKPTGKPSSPSSSKKGRKSGGKSTPNKKGAPQKSAPKVVHKRRKTWHKIMPILLILLSLILTVCYITVHVAGMEDGVGTVGYAIQWFFGGLLGGAAPFLPIFLAYIGILWCAYNIKWAESDRAVGSERFADYRKAKRRLGLKISMTLLTVLTLATVFGVLEGYNRYDPSTMWLDGAEQLFIGGGILGSSLGYLMYIAFQTMLSMILLVLMLIFFILLMFGLTPDYLVEKIRENRALREEEQAYLDELARKNGDQKPQEKEKPVGKRPQKATEAPAEEAVDEPAPTPKKEKTSKKPADTAPAMSEDEIEAMVTEPESAEEASPVPSQESEDDPITRMMNENPPSPAPMAKDYGGEPGFDADEYQSMGDLMQMMGTRPTASAPAEEPKAEILSEDATNTEPTAPRMEEKPAEALNLSEIGAEELLSDVSEVTPEESEEAEEEEPLIPYIFPSIDLLVKNKNKDDEDHTEELKENARQLQATLNSFKIAIKDINYSRGPTITRYELRPEAGVRVRSIANLVDDIALSLATSGVRIEAPIPGKPAVGIEVPNRNRATVYLRDLIDNPMFTNAKSKLTAALGMDVGGNPIYFDISKMPHMIIAGATGMGKSVCINCVIMSILYKARPDDVKLILIDPKKVEFSLYKDIPHLYAPIVSEPKKAAGALASAVAEMERRFELIEEVGVRDIASYNAATENDPYKEHMPHMVIIIDELADLMMTAPDEVEASICRLAQKARAAGIHIIIGTQRPSVDVITGLIKANIPSRIACTVASQVDSRTIIDIAGAEKLIGRGDMLFAPVGSAKPIRVQGAFVTETEVENIVTFIKENNAKAKYNAEFVNRIEEEAAKCGNKKSGGSDAAPVAESDGGDSKFQAAVKLAVEEGKISTSLMQRRLGVGYGRAAKIIDTMEQMGYVSKPDGNKPRRVLLTAEEYARRLTEGTLGDSDD